MLGSKLAAGVLPPSRFHPQRTRTCKELKTVVLKIQNTMIVKCPCAHCCTSTSCLGHSIFQYIMSLECKSLVPLSCTELQLCVVAISGWALEQLQLVIQHSLEDFQCSNR